MIHDLSYKFCKIKYKKIINLAGTWEKINWLISYNHLCIGHLRNTAKQCTCTCSNFISMQQRMPLNICNFCLKSWSMISSFQYNCR